MGIDAGFSCFSECQTMTSRYTSECFSSHNHIQFRDVQSQNQGNLEVNSVHKGTMMPSAKKCCSQTDAFNPRCARIYKVEPSEQD